MNKIFKTKDFENTSVVSTSVYLPIKYNLMLKRIAKERNLTIVEIATEIVIKSLK